MMPDRAPSGEHRAAVMASVSDEPEVPMHRVLQVLGHQSEPIEPASFHGCDTDRQAEQVDVAQEVRGLNSVEDGVAVRIDVTQQTFCACKEPVEVASGVERSAVRVGQVANYADRCSYVCQGASRRCWQTSDGPLG
jgi:hypothetical protein